MASYQLIASETTVQVLSATVVNDVEYCTIQTSPTGVIASMPVSLVAFNANCAGEELTAFADAIEQLIADTSAVAATGVQTLDDNGLLQDQVAFTVQYVPAGSAGTSITATALVPVGLLSQSDPEIESTLLTEAEQIIHGVYANLQNAAGG